jgi:hypothetical protein
MFKNILELVEQELELRQERSKENFRQYIRMEKECKRLKKENEMLRNDLQELSKEHFKK